MRADGRIGPERIGAGPPGTYLRSDGQLARWASVTGVLGYASIYGLFTVTSDLTTATATEVGFNSGEWGDHGITTDDISDITINADDQGGIYLATLDLYVDVTANGSLTDLHQISYYDPFFPQHTSFPFLRTAASARRMSGAQTVSKIGTGSSSTTCSVKAECSGGTNRTYNVTAIVDVVRLTA